MFNVWNTNASIGAKQRSKAMTNAEIIKAITDLIEYCKSDSAKRSVIISSLETIKGECNAHLPFD